MKPLSLIPDWRLSWRFSSVQAAALLALLSVLQAEVLPMVQFAVPPQYWPYVTAAFGVGIVLLRLLSQPRLDDMRTAAAKEPAP